MNSQPRRCWNTTNPLCVKYHDEEWGVPVHDNNKLFEFLVLDSFQAGLTWLLILQRRDYFRKAFDTFDPPKVANYTLADVERLMQTPNIIHNRMKIEAAVNNAAKFLSVQKEFGSFNSYIWRFVNGRTIHNSFASLEDLPAETAESRAMSQDLKRRGFKFAGPTICYAFMQAAGLVNDHLVWCFRHKQIQEKGF
jgi:DNA-3-methyladenine glycosylase I